MNYKLIRSDIFEIQLEKILNYIEITFSKSDALDYLEYLTSQLESLKTFPNLGKQISLKYSEIEPTNAFISKKNVVFYEVNETTKEITLLAIVNSDQNYLNLMK